MFTKEKQEEFYQALLTKNIDYEGVFYVGVKSTGVFCRPTCPARKPKFINCEFYSSTQQALLASFRPCKRCKPMSNLNQVSELICRLVDVVEANPEKRWKNSDLQKLSIDASTARRQFKSRFGMTFIEYARARRIGLAMKHIRNGELVIEAQLTAGYESSSGFRDAFSKIMGSPPSNKENHKNIFLASWIDTPLGPMLAIADKKFLYMLEFVDRRGLEQEIESFRSKMKAVILPGSSEPINSIKKEMELYFSGKLQSFKTPVFFIGSDFQKDAWKALLQIPYGSTRSYKEQSKIVGNISAYRAVANANGANQLAIIIPCHRVINSNGDLGGYGGGLNRKKWLLEHEKNIAS